MARYGISQGYVAWLLHRISGLAVFAFLVVHILDIWLVGVAPEAYDGLLGFYSSGLGRLSETVLGAALLYHALNGLRLTILDFWPPLAARQRELWYASVVIFLVVALPVAAVLLGPLAGS